MRHHIMAGCDVHEKSLVLAWAVDREAPRRRCFSNDAAGRERLLGSLQEQAAGDGAETTIWLVYEASSQGYGLYDELRAAGIAAFVLAPTRLNRSVKARAQKTDTKDAELLLAILRGHVLAGNELPHIWAPDAATREHRELVRARLAVGQKASAVKAEVQMLLKRQGRRRPAALKRPWTGAHRAWLRGLASGTELPTGARLALGTLLRQLALAEEEVALLDQEVAALALTDRYRAPVAAITDFAGVGLLTAMVLLSELGDLSRFANRRRLAAYVGLAPRSAESGEATDRKGRITRQGSSRLRAVLCQCAWSRLRVDPEARARYERIKRRNPKAAKKAVVALMRTLLIRLWHAGQAAQAASGVFIDPQTGEAA